MIKESKGWADINFVPSSCSEHSVMLEETRLELWIKGTHHHMQCYHMQLESGCTGTSVSQMRCTGCFNNLILDSRNITNYMTSFDQTNH